MSIPIDVHYEVQHASSNRAKCKLCGNNVVKGSSVIKVLGFRINHTLHPECIERFVSILTLAKDVSSDPPAVVRSSGDGIIKIGIYEKVNDGYRWKTITKVNVKGEHNGGTSERTSQV